MQSAAAAGVDGAWELISLTPRQAYLRILCHQAKRNQQQRDLHFLARLTALSVHAPDRLPSPPPPPLAGEMTGEEIKQRLLAWRGKDDSP